jgi:hypothetical protein
MKTSKEMKNQELIEAAKKYDREMNEGGEGYNPYRSELESREIAEAANAPRTEFDILKDLEAADCAIARESGTYNQAKVDALRAELKAIKDKKLNDFLAVWTKEITIARRAEWNAFIRSLNGKMDLNIINKKESELGWTMADLKIAVRHYAL